MEFDCDRSPDSGHVEKAGETKMGCVSDPEANWRDFWPANQTYAPSESSYRYEYWDNDLSRHQKAVRMSWARKEMVGEKYPRDRGPSCFSSRVSDKALKSEARA